jgi:cobyrinic acid a,c-diamide synthase
MILEYASGNPVHQLDLWMVGEEQCRQLLFEAAADADIILVEGVMGLYDGIPSSADLAEKFNLPILAVVNASAMAQTFHAIAHGLATYRDGLSFAGVVANCVASDRHAEMLGEGGSPAIPYLGSISRDQEIALPERHLGLVQASELKDLESKLDVAAYKLLETKILDLLPAVEFAEPETTSYPRLLEGLKIGVAQDDCFSFLYPANLNLLESMGAELQSFSPLNQSVLPDVDSIYLPGGYPELHLDQLQDNLAMRRSIREHFESGRTIYAECGGMLYLLDTLTDKEGRKADMLGLIPGHAFMQSRLARLGYQEVQFPSGFVRGHTFHHSLVQPRIAVALRARHPLTGQEGEAIYRIPGIYASYLHLYFPSNPVAVAGFFLKS